MRRSLEVTVVGPGSLGSALAKALHDAGFPVAGIVYRSAESGRRAKRLAKEIGARAVYFERWLGESRSFARLDRQECLSHIGRAWKPVSTFGNAVPTTDATPTTEAILASKASASLIWLCVGDAEIGRAASAMTERRIWKGATVFHSSGAMTSDELEPLRRAGAHVASVHPMMTFVRSSAPSMKGVPFALEGDQPALRMARTTVRNLGGETFTIRTRNKPLYHALGAFVSPLIIAQMATVERIGRELGLNANQTRRIITPILQQTVRNYIEHGPAAAFSGPIVRGDADTIRKNLSALKRVRGAEDIYRVLAKVAVEELPSRDAAAVKKAIKSIR